MSVERELRKSIALFHFQKNNCHLVIFYLHIHTHTHTHIYIYIYIYIYICISICIFRRNEFQKQLGAVIIRIFRNCFATKIKWISKPTVLLLFRFLQTIVIYFPIFSSLYRWNFKDQKYRQSKVTFCVLTKYAFVLLKARLDTDSMRRIVDNYTICMYIIYICFANRQTRIFLEIWIKNV